MSNAFRLIPFFAILALGGCMSWTRGWESPPVAPVSPAQRMTIAQADALFDEAGDGASVRRAIDAYESLLTGSAADLPVHTRLAEAHVLYGAAYAASRAEKRRHYQAGLSHAEQAMATNPEFRKRISSGASVAEATVVLGEPEMEAMLIWVTGVSYYFKEGVGVFGKVLAFRTISQTRDVLERLMELDPEFEEGAVPFSLAIHYIARPPWAGRDLPRALELFDRAVAISPESLLIRWGRAKYLHSRTGDTKALRNDLEWVISHDPRDAATPYHWNVYFQRDAKEMLANLRR